jgi:hypothetical protein
MHQIIDSSDNASFHDAATTFMQSLKHKCTRACNRPITHVPAQWYSYRLSLRSRVTSLVRSIDKPFNQSTILSIRHSSIHPPLSPSLRPFSQNACGESSTLFNYACAHSFMHSCVFVSTPAFVHSSMHGIHPPNNSFISSQAAIHATFHECMQGCGHACTHACMQARMRASKRYIVLPFVHSVTHTCIHSPPYGSIHRGNQSDAHATMHPFTLSFIL